MPESSVSRIDILTHNELISERDPSLLAKYNDLMDDQGLYWAFIWWCRWDLPSTIMCHQFQQASLHYSERKLLAQKFHQF